MDAAHWTRWQSFGKQLSSSLPHLPQDVQLAGSCFPCQIHSWQSACPGCSNRSSCIGSLSSVWLALRALHPAVRISLHSCRGIMLWRLQQSSLFQPTHLHRSGTCSSCSNCSRASHWSIWGILGSNIWIRSVTSDLMEESHSIQCLLSKTWFLRWY